MNKEGINQEDYSGLWCVWTKKGRRPKVFHTDKTSAETEASRLAALNPGNKFIVMQMLSKFSAVEDYDRD